MTAILRAYGNEFDVDAFLRDCPLPVCAVKRRGEPMFPASQTNLTKHDRSGVHVVASDAEFHEFPRQVSESAAFLQRHFEQVQRMCKWPGVEGVTLDFGVVRRDSVVESDVLSKELIRVAGELGIAIEISRYPAQDSKEDAEQSLATESR
jgi:hypothetical protein